MNAQQNGNPVHDSQGSVVAWVSRVSEAMWAVWVDGAMVAVCDSHREAMDRAAVMAG